jgi:hypothetical protein
MLVLACGVAGALALATCSESSDPCSGVACSSRGFCIQDQGTAYCACLHGYHPTGLGCTANDAADPCAGIDCGGHGTCRADGDDVSCQCADGYVWVTDPTSAQCVDAECDLTCVAAEEPEGPCDPADCGAWCRRMWGGLTGLCVLGMCTCTTDCDPAACQADCLATGYARGDCVSWSCECTGTGADADADAEDVPDGADDDADGSTEPDVVLPDAEPEDAGADEAAIEDAAEDAAPVEDAMPPIETVEAA